MLFGCMTCILTRECRRVLRYKRLVVTPALVHGILAGWAGQLLVMLLGKLPLNIAMSDSSMKCAVLVCVVVLRMP